MLEIQKVRLFGCFHALIICCQPLTHYLILAETLCLTHHLGRPRDHLQFQDTLTHFLHTALYRECKLDTSRWRVVGEKIPYANYFVRTVLVCQINCMTLQPFNFKSCLPHLSCDTSTLNFQSCSLHRGNQSFLFKRSESKRFGSTLAASALAANPSENLAVSMSPTIL